MAGEACSNESVSNKKFTGIFPLADLILSNGLEAIGNLIRSPDDKESNLLSSKHEFNASIQAGSIYPSNTIIGHIYGSFESKSLTADLAAFVKLPSIHYFVVEST